MPLEHEIDEERNLVVARISGPVEPAAVLKHLETLRGDGRLRPGYRSLVDLSDALPGPGVDGDFVRQVAERARHQADAMEPARVAVLAPSDVIFGLARMYASLVEAPQRNVRVFRDDHSARRWLCGDDAPEQDAPAGTAT